MNATDRAALLGTEHGTQAAQVWQRDCAENLASIAAGYDNYDPCPRPLPDLSGPGDGYSRYRLAIDAGLDTFPRSVEVQACVDAYEAAFRAAVDSTIRQACDTTQ